MTPPPDKMDAEAEPEQRASGTAPAPLQPAPTNWNCWTGGQYSLVRAVFGLMLFGLFLSQAFRMHTVGLLATIGIAWVGMPVAVLFAIGFWHRTAAAVLIGLLALLHVNDVLDMGPGAISAGLALAMHLFMPSTPYGSWAARGMPDPSGGWRMPREVYVAAWVFLSLIYIGQGMALVEFGRQDFTVDKQTLWILGGMHFAFGLVCFLRPVRPWMWLAMLGVQVYLIFMPLDWWWCLFILPLHMLAFDPGWIRPAMLQEKVVTFYDGHCGLCHRAVRFLLAEDRTGKACDFAPLEGPVFQSLVTAEDEIPDSMVVAREDGRMLFRSSAALLLGRRLGGLWRLFATLAMPIPVRLRDAVYDFVAYRRRRWFPPTTTVCPLVTGPMRARFQDVDSLTSKAIERQPEEDSNFLQA